jgi:hypothetical protein
VLGTVAVTAGTGVTFGATGLIAFGLVAWTARHPDPEHAPVPGAILGQLRDALRAGGFGLGFWLVTLEAMTFGATGVLIPLRLSHLGAPGWEIGGVFVAASALSTVLSPLVGRVVDRRGAPITLAVGLATAAPLIAALALPGSATELAVLAVIALGIPLTAGMIPSLALMTGATERAAVSLILATTAVNFAFALGEVIGAPSAAAISQATGDWVPLVGIAALMVASLGLLRRAKDAVAGDNRPRGALHTARGATTPDPEHRPRRRNRRRADLPDRPSPVRVGTAPPALCGDAAGAEPRPGGAAERP